jgi:hypothetical protein
MRLVGNVEISASIYGGIEIERQSNPRGIKT